MGSISPAGRQQLGCSWHQPSLTTRPLHLCVPGEEGILVLVHRALSGHLVHCQHPLTLVNLLSSSSLIIIKLVHVVVLIIIHVLSQPIQLLFLLYMLVSG